MIQRLETGLVYRNPIPHRRSIHAWHPTLVVLDDGQLLSAFDLGEAVESVDYRSYLSRSSDNGHTWTPPSRIFPDANDRLQRHTARLTPLRDGTIVAMGSRRYLEHAEEDVFNRATFGGLPGELILLRSKDQGHTWQGPTVVQSPLSNPLEICHAVIELADGRWLLPTSILRHWDGTAPDGVKAVALVSEDEGRTWNGHLDVLDSYDRGCAHFEVSLIQLPDGRLLAASWEFEFASGRSHPLPYAISADGQTFGPARATGLNGETSKMLSLGDDRVLVIYRRFDKPGLWAALVRIKGDTWVNLEEIPLWQGAPSKMFGERASADELSALQFGFPQPHRLPDGKVMVVFWCREDGVHNIRWLRVAVD
jgi:sialidase-1